DAQQLDLHPIRTHGCAVDHDERAARTPRLPVQQPRRNLLARAGGTADQHAAARGGHALDRLAHGGDGTRYADELGRPACPQAKLLVLPPERCRLDRPGDDQQQPIRLERLLDEVVGALLDGGDSCLDGSVTADHHHRHQWMLLLEHTKQLEPVQLALLKPYVQDDQARLPRAHRFERFLAVLGGASLVPLVAEDAGDEHADIRLVIDYENVTRHQTAVIKSEFYPLCAVF